jgi:hypothetical protein
MLRLMLSEVLPSATAPHLSVMEGKTLVVMPRSPAARALPAPVCGHAHSICDRIALLPQQSPRHRIQQ